MNQEGKLGCDDKEHFKATHDRWPKGFRDPDLYEGQCCICWYYVKLEGKFGTDWGACSNPDSPNDGKLLFEHDGCDKFVDESVCLDPSKDFFSDEDDLPPDAT